MIGNCLYQTISNKNRHDLEKIAPFKCTRSDAWLGEGYYFWDTFIELAHQWGRCAYETDYIICRTSTTCPDEDFLDLVGNTTQIKDLKDIVLNLEKLYAKKLTIPFVVNYLRNIPSFPYKAIRIQSQETFFYLAHYNRFFKDKKNAYFSLCPSIQCCIIDKSILKLPVVVEYCSSDEHNTECL